MISSPDYNTKNGELNLDFFDTTLRENRFEGSFPGPYQSTFDRAPLSAAVAFSNSLYEYELSGSKTRPSAMLDDDKDCMPRFHPSKLELYSTIPFSDSATHNFSLNMNACKRSHGQITPPDDLSPNHTNPLQAFEAEDNIDNEKNEDNAKVKNNRKKAKQSVSAEVVEEPMKRVRANNTSKQKEVEMEEEDKREKFLERNRIAASKCRQKKKEYITGLEDRARELTSTRTHLQAYVAALKEEILVLKSEMLKHTDCECVTIRDYLKREAMLLSESYGLRERAKDSLDERKLSIATSHDMSDVSPRNGSTGANSDPGGGDMEHLSPLSGGMDECDQ